MDVVAEHTDLMSADWPGRVVEAGSGGQIEAPAMKGTMNHAIFNRSLGQRASLVGAFVVESMENVADPE